MICLLTSAVPSAKIFCVLPVEGLQSTPRVQLSLAWIGILHILRSQNHQRFLILRLDVTGAGSGFRRNMASDSAQGEFLCVFIFQTKQDKAVAHVSLAEDPPGRSATHRRKTHISTCLPEVWYVGILAYCVVPGLTLCPTLRLPTFDCCGTGVDPYWACLYKAWTNAPISSSSAMRQCHVLNRTPCS